MEKSPLDELIDESIDKLVASGDLVITGKDEAGNPLYSLSEEAKEQGLALLRTIKKHYKYTLKERGINDCWVTVHVTASREDILERVNQHLFEGKEVQVLVGKLFENI